MIDLSIHRVSLADFKRLSPLILNLTEWESAGATNSKATKYYYLSGRVVIGEFRMTLFSEEYEESQMSLLGEGCIRAKA